MKKISILAVAASLTLPMVAAAADLQSFLDTIVNNVLTPVTTFIIVLAAFVLILGIFKYITAGGDEEKVKEGRRYIIYGIIGIALMTMIYGLVNIITSTLGISNETAPTITL